MVACTRAGQQASGDVAGFRAEHMGWADTKGCEHLQGGGGLKAEAHRVHGHLGPFIRLGPPREDEVLVRKMLTWTADSLQNGFQGTPLETSGGQD